MLLEGQVAIITGSSRGIGRAIALKMAAEGAAVVINGLNAERVGAIVEEVRAQGGNSIGICESVETMNGGERIVAAALKTFGKLDILVNNAGNIRDRMSYRLDEEDWDQVIDTHLKGCFACTKPAIIHMRARKQGGCIVNMTSTAGLHGTIGQLNYSAAKAGILGLTWTLALELRRDTISVNAIAPAALTDMTRPYVEKATQDALNKGEDVPEYWKIGAPEDVANFVVALVSPPSRSITGTIFSVNGSQIGLWEQPRHRMLSDQRNAPWSPEELLTQVLVPFMEDSA